jgi:seryl-tRNA synthetase
MSEAEVLKSFKEAVDEEIKVYEEMETLYKIKQSVLIQCKTDELWNVDSKIVSQINTVKNLSEKRKNVGKYLGNENITMSEIIEKAMNSNKDLAEEFKVQKKKLNTLTTAISLYENTNLELIKHGLEVTDKKLSIIYNTITPHSNQYNNNGQKTTATEQNISSVIEEV